MGLIYEHRGQKIIRGCAVSAMCLSNALKRKHISKIPTSFLASVSLVLLPQFCHSCIRLCLLEGIFKARQFYQHPCLLLNGYLRCYFLAAYLMVLRSEALWFSAVGSLIPIPHTVGLRLQQSLPGGTLPTKPALSDSVLANCLHTLIIHYHQEDSHTHIWTSRLGE